MNITRIMIAITFSVWSLSVQGQSWHVLNSGTSSNLKDVFFVNTDIGWIVGKNGIIKKSLNGGTSWVTQVSGTSKELKSVYFMDPNTGIAVGKDGVILKTTNGGNTWTVKSVSVSDDFSAVSFYGNSNGVIVGEDGLVLTTSDGGETWTQRNSGTSNDLHSVQIINPTLVYASGKKGTILQSVNAGQTWATVNSSSLYDFIDQHYPSANKGYFTYEADGSDGGSEGSMYTFVNNNLTLLSLPTSKQLYTTFFVTDNIGWAAGDEGRILYTNNGGQSWTAQTLSNVSKTLESLFFISANYGFAVGEDGVLLRYGGHLSDIEENSVMAGSFFPNPFSDVLHITIPENLQQAEIEITDITGKTLTAQKLYTNGILEINTQDWKPGVYIARFTSAEKSYCTKIIKK